MIEPSYLTEKATDRGLPARFVKLEVEINTAMQERVVGEVVEAANVATFADLA